MSRPVLSAIFLLALLLGAAALWLAGETWEHYERGENVGLPEARDGRKMAEYLPLEEILQRLQLPPGSHILEVEREMENQRLYYEIELLMPDGRVLEWYVDPRTAEVVKTEQEEIEAHHETATGGR